MPNVKLVTWKFFEDEEEITQRERMLTAFILGAAKEVKTPYWVKMDADAYAVDDSPLLIPEMSNFVITGHRWGYSLKDVFTPLIPWSNSHPAFIGRSLDRVDPSKIDGRRYNHKRIASFVCVHDSAYVRKVAAMCGERLPSPSHDTLVWYVAERLDLPYMRYNFKRKAGMGNQSKLDNLRAKLAEIG
tara:strand:+ start:75 stop:635 length:561 start_codon:yes stop_codon:yes gene_type:complete